MSNYQQLDTISADMIYRRASEWVDKRSVFNSAKSVAKMAVAEYMANERGYTFYKLEKSDEQDHIPRR